MTPTVLDDLAAFVLENAAVRDVSATWHEAGHNSKGEVTVWLLRAEWEGGQFRLDTALSSEFLNVGLDVLKDCLRGRFSGSELQFP